MIPIVNRRLRFGGRVGIRMFWVEKMEKIISRRGVTSIRHSIVCTICILLGYLRSKLLSRFYESWESTEYIRLINNIQLNKRLMTKVVVR